MEHEKVQAMLNGIRTNSLDATVEIIQASNKMKNDYKKASSFILAAIGRHNEKSICSGKARSFSAANTKPRGGRNPKNSDKGQHWVKKDGVCDFRGIKKGQYDDHLDGFFSRGVTLIRSEGPSTP